MAVQPRCLFAYPDYTTPQPQENPGSNIVTVTTPVFDPAVGSWQATMPLANQTKGELFYPARSTDATLASTKFKIDYGVSRPFNVFALVRHNLTPKTDGTVQWRVTLSDHSDMSAPYYASGWTNAYQNFYAPNTLPLGWSLGMFTGAPTVPDLIKYKSLCAVIVADQLYQARYKLVEIKDTANAQGYVQFGRYFGGPGWQPKFNMGKGARIGWLDPSSTRRTDSGVLISRKRAKYRRASFALSNMSTHEGFELPFEMVARVGVTDKVFFTADPTSLYDLHRWSFLGTLAQLSDLELVDYDQTSMPIVIEESL